MAADTIVEILNAFAAGQGMVDECLASARLTERITNPPVSRFSPGR